VFHLAIGIANNEPRQATVLARTEMPSNPLDLAPHGHIVIVGRRRRRKQRPTALIAFHAKASAERWHESKATLPLFYRRAIEMRGQVSLDSHATRSG